MCITAVQNASLNRRGRWLETRYNLSMAFATLAIRALVCMFLLGISGSAVVVLISFFQDGKELFGKD